MVDFEVDASPEQFSVGGDGWGSSGDIGGKKMKVEYGRNATHLHFKVCMHGLRFHCLHVVCTV